MQKKTFRSIINILFTAKQRIFPKEVTMTKKLRSVYIVSFIFFVAAIGYMIFSGISQNSVYFLNVSEAIAQEKTQPLLSARLFGTVAPNTIVRPEDGLGVSFALEDAENKTQTIQVQYKGVVPDTFDVGSEVIIEGSMQNNVFMAKTLMTKCPSKYQKENREKNA